MLQGASISHTTQRTTASVSIALSTVTCHSILSCYSVPAACTNTTVEFLCRDVVLDSCLGHTQSCVTLTPGPNGQLQADHSQLPDSTPVFQILAECVAGLQGLRDLRHPNARKLQAQRSSQNQQLSLDSTARQVGAINVAVIGAGACSVPAHLTHGNDNVFVHAVDIDKRTYQSFRSSTAITLYRCTHCMPCLCHHGR